MTAASWILADDAPPPCPACAGAGGEDCATSDPMFSVFVPCEECDGDGKDWDALEVAA